MKRTLVILRHGQAEPFGIVSSDYERTLVPRGVQEVRRTAGVLAQNSIHAEYLLSSAAPRALFTLKIVAPSLGADPEKIVAGESLYAASPLQLLKAVRAIPDEFASAAVCGHNPAISELFRLMNPDQTVSGFNTADAAVLEFEADSWALAGDVPSVLKLHISRPARRLS